MNHLQNILCVLCHCKVAAPFFSKTIRNQGNKHYLRCENCALVFVDSSQHLTLVDQKTFYDCHQNEPEQLGYRKHLNTLALPLLNYLKPNSAGLDFGSGPGPTLHIIFAEHGHQLQNYDPIYAAETHKLDSQYDFVTSTEVVEHFTNPNLEWIKLQSLLKPSGKLGIMTQFQPEEHEFANWWYHRDATHVCFYHPKTFEWIANELGFKILVSKNPIVIFEKVNHNKPAQ